MNDKEKVIAQMQAYIGKGVKADQFTLASWVNLLEQSERQTTPSPDGRDCAGESSVQPAAHIERVARRAWDDFCRFRDVGGRISAVAKFPGYAVRVSIWVAG